MTRPIDQLDYEFSPFEDDYRGFDPRDGDARRGPLILALAVGVLLIFGAVVWNTYREGVRPEGDVPRIVLAGDGTYKRAPEEPGGLTMPNTDRRIYDQFDGTARDPVILPASAENAELLKGGPPVDLRRGLETDVTVASPSAARETPPVRATPQAAVTPQLVAPPSVPAPRPVGWTVSSSGGFLVQVGAFRSERAAVAAWQKLKTSHPALLTKTGQDVQRADLGAKGTFYRLRASAFETRKGAMKFCDALKAENTSCIVVSR